MNNAHFTLGMVTVLCGAWSSTLLVAKGALPQPAAFDELSLHIEVDLPLLLSENLERLTPRALLELPAEVVFEASSPRRLARVRLMDSVKGTVLDLDCQRSTGLGVSELLLECEGTTLAEVLREYPPGSYLVEGTTVDGAVVQGAVDLWGRFPGIFAVVSPRPGDVLLTEDVKFSWTPSRGAARYLLEVEQSEGGFSFEIGLPPEQTTFVLPAHMLRAGESYEYSLAVQGDTDNELEIEGRFSTAPSHPR